MADPRTFVLIGNFTDNITPALEKINNSISKLKGNLSDLSHATRPLKNDFKELASLSKDFNNSIKGQSADIRQMTNALRTFRGELGRVNRAYRAGGSRLMRQAAAPPTPPAPPSAPARSRSSGYSGAVGGAVAGSVLGSQIADTLTGSIVKGFQIGVSIMERPFQYFANALGERIKDEMSDIKAAGGYFSIAKRQEQPFVKTFDQALEFTQKNNAVLAKLAASLPGSTQDYIEVSKRIGDSVARTVMADKGAAVAYANELRRQFPTMYGGALQGTGTAAQQGAITTLLGELTKKTVLAGQGGRSGAGGAIGPYGLPGLTERMLSQDQVSMGQFQRYSAIFSDPMIMDALQREIPKINATAKNSIDRFKALQKFYDDVLPPEMIEKYRRSIAGLQEAFNTAILGPETGLFGLGRKMKGLGRKMNDFGQYVDNLGNVVSDINMAATVDLSLFDMLRDILANTAQVLMPIIENITMLWDPLKTIGLSMVDARHITGQFLKSFNQYKEGIELYAKSLSKGMGAKLLETKDLRASFAAIANLFKQLGVFDTATFKDVSKQILDPNANLGKILQGLMDKFLNSDVAFKIGEFIGTLVGTVLSEIAKAMGFVTGLATGGPLAQGLMKGFENAGGSAAFASIIQNTFALLGKLLLDVVKAAPLQTAVFGALMLLPAAISGLISAAITGATAKIGSKVAAAGGVGAAAKKVVSPQLAKASKAGMAIPGVKGAAALATKGKMAGIGVAAAGIVKLATVSPKLMKVGESVTKLAKAAPGLNILFAGLDFALGKMSGESTAQAAGGAGGGLAGGLIGAAIGTAMAPGIGTAIGSVLGTLIGDWLGTNLGKEIGKFFSDPVGNLRAAIDSSKKGLSQSEASLKQWFWELPGKFGAWTIEFETRTNQSWSSLGLRFDYWRSQFSNWISNWSSKTTSDTNSKLSEFSTKMKSLFRDGIDWNGMATTMSAAVINWLKNVQNNVQGFLSNAQNWLNQFNQGRENARRIQDSQSVGGRLPSYDEMFVMPPKKGAPAPKWKGGLGDAVRSELKNKPPGSNLVIANSSETVIPAAGGYGMVDFVNVLRSGFNTMVATYKATQQKQESVLSSIRNTLVSNQQQTNTRLQKLETKFSTPTMGGLGGGSIGGGVDSFTGMAQKYGLQMTSGYRPGDPGWHGANRARDYSNGTGPTPQMMQFAQFLASNYGAKLKELIYTPLGFSIKNGQKVPPYATAGHYNHVHVAYATGYGMPFTNAMEAMRFERSMTPGSVKVGSITGNSAEGFGGGGTTINGGINVTVNGSGVNDADELASIVALKIGDAVAQARSASVFV
jgi:hypothetical protein